MTTVLNLKHFKEEKTELIINNCKFDSKSLYTRNWHFYSADGEIPCYYGNRSFTTMPLEAV
jgi:hypothetical protein